MINYISNLANLWNPFQGGESSLVNEIYQYIHQLNIYLKKHEQKINELEKTIDHMKKQFADLRHQPPIHIEKIDYHFDQLKIERLDGTLTIGLNPSDLENMDEFMIRKNSSEAPERAGNNQSLITKIEQEMHTYLDQELEKMIEDTKKQLTIDVDPSFIHFIHEDIRRQLKSRIEYFLQSYPQENRNESEQEIILRIKQQLIEDIRHGIFTFLNSFQQ